MTTTQPPDTTSMNDSPAERSNLTNTITCSTGWPPDDRLRTTHGAGVEHFDGWAANFGRTVTALEPAPDASTYRLSLGSAAK